jgi:putative redox protein
MSVKTAELTFTDGMHFETATGSGRRFAYDDPPEGGLGPVETVLTSLAACSAMDVISVALKKRQDIERYTIHVRGDQREAYPQVYTRIDLVHEVVGATVSTEAIRRCIELSATKYCPVNAMLSAGPTEVHHAYRIVRPGRPVDEGTVLVTGPYQRADALADGADATNGADELSGS